MMSVRLRCGHFTQRLALSGFDLRHYHGVTRRHVLASIPTQARRRPAECPLPCRPQGSTRRMTGGRDRGLFQDLRAAYGGHRTGEVLRAALVFSLCSYDKLVDNQTKLLRFTRALFGKYIWNAMMKRTLYGQFMAGETKPEVMGVAKRLSERGVTPWMCFTAKEIHGAASGAELTRQQMDDYCQNNYDNMLESLDLTEESMEFNSSRCRASTKVTCFTSPALLRNLSDYIRWVVRTVENQLGQADQTRADEFTHLITEHASDLTRLKSDFHTVAEQHANKRFNVQSLLTNMTFLLTFPQEAKEKGFIQESLPELSHDDMKQAVTLWNRMKQTGQMVKDRGVWMNWDAEQTAYQPAIEVMALDTMRLYNQGNTVVTSTYQCYLKNAKVTLLRDLQLADEEGFCLGCKIVRGAYMEEERRVSRAEGLEYPINPSYDVTTHMYYDVANTILAAIKQAPVGKIQATFATHNGDTVEYVVKTCEQMGVELVPESVAFAQLIGMRDYISFSLAGAGIPVCKLLHYGSIEEGMAMMTRRLQENRSGLPTAQVERDMCRRELKRRLLRR